MRYEIKDVPDWAIRALVYGQSDDLTKLEYWVMHEYLKQVQSKYGFGRWSLANDDGRGYQCDMPAFGPPGVCHALVYTPFASIVMNANAKTPKRRFWVEIKFGAESREELLLALDNIWNDWRDSEELILSQIEDVDNIDSLLEDHLTIYTLEVGCRNYNGHLAMQYNPRVTREMYFEALARLRAKE